MKTLDSAIITAKNALSVDAPWVILIELTLPDTTVIRMARERDDVTYDGNTYTALPMAFGTVNQSSDGRLPSLTMQIANPTRVLEPYLHLLDGLSGCAVSMLLIYDTDSPVLADKWGFVVTRSASAEGWVEVELGARNLYKRRIPRDRYIPGFCRHVFRGAVCQFTGGVVGPLDTIAFVETDSIVILGNQTGELAEDQRIAVSGSADNDGEFVIDGIETVAGSTPESVIGPLTTISFSEFNTIVIPGDHAGELAVDRWIAVSGSIHNDGRNVVVSAVYSSPNTTVTVTPANIADEAAGNAVTITVYRDYTLITVVPASIANESAGEDVTMTAICDHTLVTCRGNGNSERFGGSPGMDGGMYA